MTKAMRHVTKKSILMVLLLGNVTLGLTIFLQDRIIDNQRHLIRLLYHDSAELAGFKIAKNVSHAGGR
jgi:hypothetical protein